MKTKKEVQAEMAKAKAYGEYLVAKAQNPLQKFLNHSPMCQLCLGTGTRITYKYGVSYAKRCEAAIYDEQRKKWSCSGNSDWRELEKENKRDLSKEIWKIVSKEKLKNAFMLYLKQDYHTEQFSSLFTKQLHTILCMLRSGRLIPLLYSYNLSTQSHSYSQKVA